MDELIALVRSLHKKIDSLHEEIEELKSQQRPVSSKDYTFTLQKTTGKEFSKWMSDIVINASDIETILEKSSKNSIKVDKNYFDLLEKIKSSDSLNVFSSYKNVIYIYKNKKWITMRKEETEMLQGKLQTKIRECFRTMVKNKDSILQKESIKELSYMEQRNKISQISAVSHTIFRNDFYKILINHTEC